MNFVFLSPNFPENYGLFCVELQKLKVNVLGIGDSPYLSLRPELRTSLAEYYRVNNLNDYEQILRACGYFCHKYGKIDRFESHNEFWLETDAQIRTDFNIMGLRTAGIEKMKSRSKMRKAFKSGGIAVPRAKVIKNPKPAKRFAKEVGYPVIIRPDKYSGQPQTCQIRNERELEDYFTGRPAVNYIIEEYIQADIMTFDGLTDQDGNLVFYTCHKYSPNLPETINEEQDFCYYSFRDIPERIEEFGFKCLKLFDIKERFFHLLFFYPGQDQPIIALKFNARPANNLALDMFNYACDIDVYRQWANIVVSNRSVMNCSRRYHSCYIGTKTGKNYAHPHEEIMDSFGHLIVHYQKIPALFYARLGQFGYIIRTPYLEEVFEAVKYIHELK